MATKRENLTNPKSCWNKAADDEPLFILRANDPVASKVVRIWASLSEGMKTQPRVKTGGAWQVAVAMENWREERLGPVPLPDVPHPRKADPWFTHTPGDPMPCSSELRVDVMTRRERDKNEWRSSPGRAANWMWGSTATDERLARSGEIIAWRPA